MSTRQYRVTLDRPSRSKCPNAWATCDGIDGWAPSSFLADEGAELTLGGNVRRATRTERVREVYTIDADTGTWKAWGGAGRLTIEAV